jgi:hydrogenase-4 component E
VSSWLDTVLILLILTNLQALGSSRLESIIRAVAFQGILLAALMLLVHHDARIPGVWLPAAGSLVLKGIAFPWLLFRALRTAGVPRAVQPYVGSSAALLLGVVALAVSLWMGSRFPLPRPALSALMLSVAYFSILAGFLLIVSRRQALTQVLGYLVLENGIYVFGLAIAQENPLLFELGVLLDVFVAVFVMGITIFHISREFDHIDTEQLSTLRDWTP